MQRDFLWELGDKRRDHLLRWDMVRKPLEMGDLRLGNISLRNDALLAKWLWRFPKENGSMWQSVIKAKYRLHDNGWDSKSRGRVKLTYPWKNINRIYSRFITYTRYDLGNGKRIKFWEDKWWGDVVLATKFQRIFSISSKKYLPISCFYSLSSPCSSVSWDLGLCRGLRDHEIEEVSLLISFLFEVFIDPMSSNSCLWSLTSSGTFSFSFHQKLIVCSNLSSAVSPSFPFPFNSIWKSHSPPHYKAFCWEVAHKCVNTSDMIRRRHKGWCLLPHVCHLCLREDETVNHIFIHYPYALEVWWFTWRPASSIMEEI